MAIEVTTGGAKKFVYKSEDPKASKGEKRQIRIGYYENAIEKLKEKHKSEIKKLKEKQEKQEEKYKRIIKWISFIFVVILIILYFYNR